ncbi:collagen alpha-1(I) chain-like [Mastomys coucha]|uniref:collagen alpha-1(I) chain-like n=1 Tax=Mastomys coucha TaxID=35658 RepID=UPI001262A31B|nr:collagen alpha-1(I) chain-like [Mastomys coucha]
MAAGARARHGARAALRTTLLRSSRPSPSHSPAAALRASPASPLFGGPLLSRLQSPEVDVAAWQRGRGGGRSASGETGPGLVFVNLPRSRRGQRRPRAPHGVPGAWTGRRAEEETAGGRAGQVGARRGEAASSGRASGRAGGRAAAPQQLAGRGAPRAKGEGSAAEEGRAAEGGGARGGPPPPRPPSPPTGRGRLARGGGRGREHAGRARPGAPGLRSGSVRALRLPAERTRPPSTSAANLRTFGRTRSDAHVWALPATPVLGTGPSSFLPPRFCPPLWSASFAGRPTPHKSPKGPPPPSSVPTMANPSTYSVGRSSL